MADRDLLGGISGRQGAPGPRTALFSLEQLERYSRHILLAEVGGAGQRRLLGSRVLIVGAGGLGSPAALYLAAAGVGTLGLIDHDVVEQSNLQRQILHRQQDLGRPKVESAADTIRSLNPDVEVIAHPEALGAQNAREIVRQYDIVVNGSDNFPTRYLTNDACVFEARPLVDGAIYRFDGQATVFLPGQGCYRCIFPTPPPPGLVPSCAEIGVMGVVPGIIGCIEAMEAIKLILGIGETLAGRLLLLDALTMEFRTLSIQRNPKCPVCGDNPSITELIDYNEYCGVPNGSGRHGL